MWAARMEVLEQPDLVSKTDTGIKKIKKKKGGGDYFALDSK